MSAILKIKLNKFLKIATAICFALIVCVSAAFAATDVAVIFTDGVDYTTPPSVGGRFYIVGKDSIGAPIAIAYAGTPLSTIVMSDVFENFCSPVNNDIAVALIERELNSGTTSHVGFYAVNNITITKDSSHDLFMSTLRSIPVPTATQQNGNVLVSWTQAVDDGTGNIVGYKVYRGTDGINFSEIAEIDAATTSIVDGTVSPGTTYYYALRLIFRGTSGVPEIESMYLSANSTPLTVGTPGVSIIQVIPETGLRNATINIQIIGSGTHFNSGSGAPTVLFEGVNGITVNSSSAVDDTNINANITISLTAVYGPRNVVVRTPDYPTPGTDEVAVGINKFWVIPSVLPNNLTLNPGQGVQGATFDIEVTGGAGYFVQGATTAYFGPDITVNSITVTSPTSVTANITIGPDATPGTVDAIFFTNGEVDSGQFEILARDVPPETVPNYPNPFDPNNGEETRIVVEPDNDGTVGVYIYDITARLVFRHTEYMTAASYNEVVWNGRTYFGEIADNGVYLVRVIDEGSRKIIGKGKILVVKYPRR